MKNNHRTKSIQPKKEMILDSLKLPKDICMGALKVTMTGNREAWIENYRGILEYTEQMIRVKSHFQLYSELKVSLIYMRSCF